MEHKKIADLISFLVFSAFLITLALLTVFIPKKDFSDVENRMLQKFPEFSVKTVFNRSFMNGIDDYLSDHFAGRTGWINIKTATDLALGKGESGGVFILGDRLLDDPTPPDYTEIGKSVDAINKYSESIKTPVYVMIAPTSTELYRDELNKYTPVYDQKAMIDDVYNRLGEKIVTLDVYKSLYLNRDEYIYYRNDHHWTTLGAYYAYSAASKKLGFTAISKDKFDIEHAANNFKGTLYSKAVYDGVEADVLDIYNYPDGASVTKYVVNDGRKETEYPGIYFMDYLNKKDKYSVFTGPNQPLCDIYTNLDNGPSILIFKDSYAHCLVPFLAEHYSRITMVDLRYVNAVSQVVDADGYDSVLFMYNADSFATDENIKKVGYK